MPPTPTLRLLPIDAALVRAVADPDDFERLTGATLGGNAALAREVVAQHVAHRARTAAPEEWGAFFASTTDEAPGVVGTCAFVGPPSASGEVEIAYFTFPEFEGRGYGTAMARALVRRAADAGARLVYAHTLREINASTRILTTLGFRQAGTAEDHEAGTVWRWEREARADA
jgi:RimJ/RimL family protein N-acetyltransferase